MDKQKFEKMCRDVANKSLDLLVRQARALRVGADASEQEFLLFLVALDRSDKWKEGGACATFEKFLDRYDICKPARYANWRRAIEELPFDAVALIGVNGAVAAIEVEESRRETVVERMVERAKSNGVPLSKQTAIALAKRGVDTPTREERERTRIAELESELSAARSRVRELEHENKMLRVELAELRERPGGDDPPPKGSRGLGRHRKGRGSDRSQPTA